MIRRPSRKNSRLEETADAEPLDETPRRVPDLKELLEQGWVPICSGYPVITTTLVHEPEE